jgi:hypothetical protein
VRPGCTTWREGITNLYREVLYLYLQRFIYRGQIVFFGTTSNPVGCAVAYRRKYVRALFDYIGPILGDDLTNSEDIFIGFAMVNEGYRNIQLTDVYARTVEPEVQRLPRQIYLWSSSFLQSCYYFDPLLRSPFKALKRWRARKQPRDIQPGTRRRVPQTPAYAGAQMTALAPAGGRVAGTPIRAADANDRARWTRPAAAASRRRRRVGFDVRRSPHHSRAVSPGVRPRSDRHARTSGGLDSGDVGG